MRLCLQTSVVSATVTDRSSSTQAGPSQADTPIGINSTPSAKLDTNRNLISDSLDATVTLNLHSPGIGKDTDIDCWQLRGVRQVSRPSDGPHDPARLRSLRSRPGSHAQAGVNKNVS